MVEENTQEIYFAHLSLDMDMCLNLIIYQDLEGRHQSKVTSLTKLFSQMILIFTIVTFPEVGNVERSRTSTIELSVPLPQGHAPITIGWTADDEGDLLAFLQIKQFIVIV